MARSSSAEKDYAHLLQENSLKGESYYIKFKNDTNIYLGIPVLRSNLSSKEEDSFTLNVIEPKEKSGVYQKLISEIQFLEKR